MAAIPEYCYLCTEISKQRTIMQATVRFEILQIMSPPEDVKFSNVRGHLFKEIRYTRSRRKIRKFWGIQLRFEVAVLRLLECFKNCQKWLLYKYVVYILTSCPKID